MGNLPSISFLAVLLYGWVRPCLSSSMDCRLLNSTQVPWWNLDLVVASGRKEGKLDKSSFGVYWYYKWRQWSFPIQSSSRFRCWKTTFRMVRNVPFFLQTCIIAEIFFRCLHSTMEVSSFSFYYKDVYCSQVYNGKRENFLQTFRKDIPFFYFPGTHPKRTWDRLLCS